MFEKSVAVILCGGRGYRMGILTENKPKSLIEVMEKPILWYIFNFLYKQGVRNFIFPIGYQSEMISQYITNEFMYSDVNIIIKDTGVDTSISKRLFMIKKEFLDFKEIILLNGDTIINFNLQDMFDHYKKSSKNLSLSYMNVTSSYGLILEKDEQIISFKRKISISECITSEDGYISYINAGISLIKTKALLEINLNTDEDFEEYFYSHAIKNKQITKFKLSGKIYPFDTQKDILEINESMEFNIKSLKNEFLELKNKENIKDDIVTRYAYKTRYVQNEKKLLERIKNKTIIPHQVEIQPGRESGKKLCWLNCPYCYGGTSINNGERLSLDRYKEILNQMANGPHGKVDKIIFAGYATDPLNYEHINDLLEVAIKNKQVTGFHTKNIKISAKLIENLTRNNNREKSYFSISIDAGTNKSYNLVHGVKNLNLKIYDTVYQNTRKLILARAKNNSKLDISVTYLLTDYNNTKEEVTKFIEDYKGLGVDLIRFSFPQVPRGMVEADNKFILTRKKIISVYNNLLPIIKLYDDLKTKVLLLDLDTEYSISSARVLPCFARYIFPSIGFDGRLYHCSESSAPHFHDMSLGDLRTNDFWELFYNYNIVNFLDKDNKTHTLMNKLDCRCDRKEHAVNSIFEDIL